MGSVSGRGGVSHRGGSKSNWSLNHSGGSISGISCRSGISHRGGSSYHWSFDGNPVGVCVGGGDGGGDGGLDYSWGSGIGKGGGGNGRGCVCCRGGIGYGGCGVRSDCRSSKEASRGGGEEEGQDNLWSEEINPVFSKWLMRSEKNFLTSSMLSSETNSMTQILLKQFTVIHFVKKLANFVEKIITIFTEARE
jgi:hypothetical protein